MRTLSLFRHAKSSWEDDSLDDHARPLAGRGRRAAPAMGAWLAREGTMPDLVYCSDAARALETWELAAAELDAAPPMEPVPDIYHAGADHLLGIVRSAPPDVRSLMLVGHNPGFHDLANGLVQPGESRKAVKRLRQKLPTGAIVEIEFDVDDWSQVGPGSATLRRFVRPKDLPRAGKLEL